MLAKGALSFLWSPAFAMHRQGWTLGRPTKLPCFGGQHLEQVGNGEITQQRWNQGLGSCRLMLLMASHTFNSIHCYQREIDLINFLKIWSREDIQRIQWACRFPAQSQPRTRPVTSCSGGCGPESPPPQGAKATQSSSSYPDKKGQAVPQLHQGDKQGRLW